MISLFVESQSGLRKMTYALLKQRSSEEQSRGRFSERPPASASSMGRPVARVRQIRDTQKAFGQAWKVSIILGFPVDFTSHGYPLFLRRVTLPRTLLSKHWHCRFLVCSQRYNYFEGSSSSRLFFLFWRNFCKPSHLLSSRRLLSISLNPCRDETSSFIGICCMIPQAM